MPAARITPDRNQLAEILFPMLGLDVSGAYQSQPVGTTPSEQNVRTYEALTQRGRGGSRPGISKYVPAQHPGGANLIQEINVLVTTSKNALPSSNANNNFVQANVTNFPDSTGNTYSNITLSLPVTQGNLIVMAISINGSVLNSHTPTDTLGNSWQDGSAVGPPGFGASNDHNTVIFWWTIAGASGILNATWTMDGLTAGSHRASIALLEYQFIVPSLPFDSRVARNNNDGGTGLTTGTITVNTSLDLTLGFWGQCEGVSTVTVPTNQKLRVSQTDGSTYGGLYVTERALVGTNVTLTGTLSPGTVDNNVGFGVAFKTVAGTNDVTYQVSSSGRVNTLVAVCGGIIATANAGATSWTTPTNLTGRTPPLYFQSDDQRVVRSAQLGTNLFFVDGFNYVYLNGPENHVHTWVAEANGGSLPLDSAGYPARLICTWQGRIVLAGFLTDQNQIWLSAINDAFNWNTAPSPPPATNLPNAAMAVQLTETVSGIPSGTVTALVPYNDDVLVVGYAHEIWMLQGNPAAGGAMQLVSDSIGMAWGAPWAKGPDGTLYFMSSRTGIHAMVPGSAPQRISQQITPLLNQINTGTTTIRLAWDDQDQGLHVFITHSGSSGAETHYFWEARKNSWRPVVIGDNLLNPQCCYALEGNTPADRVVLIGSWDGYVRCWSDAATTDDGTAISSYVWLGPINTRMMDMMNLRRLVAIFGAGSGSVNYEIYTGNTAEAALASTKVYPGPNATATWTAGRNVLANVRRSGHTVWIKLLSTNQWAFEQMSAEVFSKGKVARRSLQ